MSHYENRKNIEPFHFAGGQPRHYLDFYAEVAKGNIPGHSLVEKFGSIDDLPSTVTPITDSGTYPTPTTPTSLELVSSSADDAAAGTGARSVTITGLVAGWIEYSETVALDGLTPVAVPTQFLRVYRMQVASSGTYASTAGASHNSTITLRVASAGATWALVATANNFGHGTSEIGAYSVAADKSAYLLETRAHSEGTKASYVRFFVREAADTVVAPYSPMKLVIVDHHLDGEEVWAFPAPVGPFTGPCDIGWMGSAAGTPDVEVEFELLIVDTHT